MQELRDLEDLKKKILILLETDKEFAYKLRSILIGDDFVTRTYLDEALARLSEEFDKKLMKLNESLRREFYEALAKQSEEFDKKLAKQSEEFDKKLAKQSEDLKKEFYNALAKQSEDLKKYFTEQLDKKIGKLGQRWGINTETTIYNFAKDLVKEWGGSVEKWRKDIEVRMGSISYFRPFEVDIIISDGKVIAVEIKSSCGISEVMGFIEAVRMYEEEKGVKVDEKRIVTFHIYDEAREVAEANGIKVITYYD